jgi:hypothetical protein
MDAPSASPTITHQMPASTAGTKREIMSDKILIIGSGFAGFWAAVAAKRVAGPGQK